MRADLSVCGSRGGNGDGFDLLQLHVWDDGWAEEEEFRETALRLKGEGIVSSFGISLNRWELARRGGGWTIVRRSTRILGHPEAGALFAKS